MYSRTLAVSIPNWLLSAFKVGLRRLIAHCAAKRGLNTQLLYQGFQGPDHPVHPSMPETAYLKVFILRVWKD